MLDQRRLASPPQAMAEQPVPPFQDDEITKTELQASIEHARAMVKAAQARFAAPQPPAAETDAAAAQEPPQPAEIQPKCEAAAPLPASTTEQQRKLMWASAMTQVAGEISGNLANLATEPRRTDKLWATALGSSASSLAITAGSDPCAGKPIVSRGGKPARSA